MYLGKLLLSIGRSIGATVAILVVLTVLAYLGVSTLIYEVAYNPKLVSPLVTEIAVPTDPTHYVVNTEHSCDQTNTVWLSLVDGGGFYLGFSATKDGNPSGQALVGFVLYDNTVSIQDSNKDAEQVETWTGDSLKIGKITLVPNTRGITIQYEESDNESYIAFKCR